MDKKYIEALSYFASRDGRVAKPRPKGISGVGLSYMMDYRRKWIERNGRDADSGEQLYSLTEAGREAFKDVGSPS
jgi:hypothetical protein